MVSLGGAVPEPQESRGHTGGAVQSEGCGQVPCEGAAVGFPQQERWRRTQRDLRGVGSDRRVVMDPTGHMRGAKTHLQGEEGVRDDGEAHEPPEPQEAVGSRPRGPGGLGGMARARRLLLRSDRRRRSGEPACGAGRGLGRVRVRVSVRVCVRPPHRRRALAGKGPATSLKGLWTPRVPRPRVRTAVRGATLNAKPWGS